MTMASAGAIWGKYLPNGNIQCHLGAALDLPYWQVHPEYHWHIITAIKMARNVSSFVHHHRLFCLTNCR
jgi:hypothetical protein